MPQAHLSAHWRESVPPLQINLDHAQVSNGVVRVGDWVRELPDRFTIVISTGIPSGVIFCRPSESVPLATTTVGGGSKKVQARSFVGVGVRRSDTAGYVLRVLPNKQTWQYLRDPKGAAGLKLEASGSGKFVKLGSKPNAIALRAFSRGGTTTSVIATVNGHGVVSASDSGADQPDGRQTVVTTGAKGSGAGTGITASFDNVTVQVPNPFG